MAPKVNTLKINYEAVYKLGKYEQQIFAAQRAVIKAQEYVQEMQERYESKVNDFVPKGHVVTMNTTYGCMADGIGNCIYAGPDGARTGVGDRHCIYCGLNDNHHDLY